MSSYNNTLLPQADVLNEYEHGIFVLTNLAAKRAKQLKNGAPPLVRINSNHPLTISLAEISSNLIKPIFNNPEQEIALTDTVAAEMAGSMEVGFLLPAIDESEAELFANDEALEGLLADEGNNKEESINEVSSLDDLLDEDLDENEARAFAEENESNEGNVSLSDIIAEEEEEAHDND